MVAPKVEGCEQRVIRQARGDRSRQVVVLHGQLREQSRPADVEVDVLGPEGVVAQQQDVELGVEADVSANAIQLIALRRQPSTSGSVI